MEAHLSQLQDIVRLTIRQELEWSERRLKRVVMSHDASDNPAELYGADGKIYYRKAGGAGVEIGISGGGLWQSSGSVTELITPEPIELTDDLKFDGDHYIKWYETSTANLVGSVYAFQGEVQRDFMVKTYNSGILTFESAAGHIACSGDRLSDVGTPAACGDAVMVDPALHVPLAQMPLTSKGTVFAGNGTGAGVLAAGTNTHVLTLDSTAALGVKWAAGSGGAYLPLAGGAGSPMVGDLYMGDHSIMDVDTIYAHEKWAGTPIDYLTIKSQSGVKIAADFIISSDSSVTIAFYGELNMGGQSLSNAHIAGTNNTQFILDQDNTGVEQASEISFERGSSHADNARLKWSAASTRFDLMSTNSVYAALKVGSVDVSSQKITGLTAGSSSGEAVEFGQLASYLPLDGSQAMTNDLNMGGHMLWNASSLAGKYDVALPDWLFWGCNAAGDGVVEFMRWDTSEQNILMSGAIDMGDNAISEVNDIWSHDLVGIQFKDYLGTIKINLGVYGYGFLASDKCSMSGHDIIMVDGKVTGLAAGTVAGDAVRYEQLGTGVSKILNAAGTTSVECKVGGDIDITVPSSKVVTFIRS